MKKFRDFNNQDILQLLYALRNDGKTRVDIMMNSYNFSTIALEHKELLPSDFNFTIEKSLRLLLSEGARKGWI